MGEADAGLECEGSECSEGPIVLAAGQDGPNSIAIHNEVVYWTNQGNTSDDASGTVNACPVAGCPETGPTVLYQELAMPAQLHVRGSSLYYLRFAFGTVSGAFKGLTPVRGSIDGGTISLEDFLMNPSSASGEALALTVDSQFVYFSHRGSNGSTRMAACDLVGCPNDGNDIYILEDEPGQISAVTSRNQVGYYAKLEQATLARRGIAAQQPEDIFSPAVSVVSLQTDGTDLFWATGLDPEQNPGLEIQNHISRVAVTGGAKEELAEVDLISSMVLDGEWLYFAETSGRIARVNTDGGSIEELASGQDDPRGLALDASHIYWVNFGNRSGSVMKLARP